MRRVPRPYADTLMTAMLIYAHAVLYFGGVVMTAAAWWLVG